MAFTSSLPFTAAEWAALFPAAPPPSLPKEAPQVLRLLASEDRGAAARDAHPLTRGSLIAALSWSPALAAFVGLELRLRRFSSATAGARLLGGFASLGFLLALQWIFNGGRFGTRQLIVATVQVVVSDAFWAVPVVRGRVGGEAPKFIADAERLLDSSQFAGVARYLQLVRTAAHHAQEPGKSSASSFGLLAHDDEDVDTCPCPRDTCAGSIRASLPVQPLLTFLTVFLAFNFTAGILTYWTGIVTFREQTWGTTWSATLTAVSIAYFTFFLFFNALNYGATVSNPALLQLELRLRVRAVAICLDDLITRMEHLAAAREHADKPGPVTIEQEPYVVLHAVLAASWRRRFYAGVGARLVSVMGVAAETSAICVGMFGAGCINAGRLATFGIMCCMLFLELFTVAASNLEATRIATMYTNAALDLRALAFRAIGDPAAAESVRLHAEMLGGLAGIEKFQTRFFGVLITFGAVRTIAVTAFTVGVGLWSVLRGAGIGVTVESVCPGGS
ncbi:hypothetical protein DFJ74DRAFT_765359 [Hyaloraphidium curvatum]|nr:hypothetical protein DFJ74DRAFT_765359 [Hyaloraphidium curvatum]